MSLVCVYMNVFEDQQMLGKNCHILNTCVAFHLDSFQHLVVMQQTDLTTVVNCDKFKIFIRISHQAVESMYMIGNITVENNLLNAYDVR